MFLEIDALGFPMKPARQTAGTLEPASLPGQQTEPAYNITAAGAVEREFLYIFLGFFGPALI